MSCGPPACLPLALPFRPQSRGSPATGPRIWGPRRPRWQAESKAAQFSLENPPFQVTWAVCTDPSPGDEEGRCAWTLLVTCLYCLETRREDSQTGLRRVHSDLGCPRCSGFAE